MATTYTVTRATEIHAPAAKVYALIADLRQWRRWSPAERLDPGMERSYRGPDLGVGAIYAWSGRRRVGTGRMEITESTEGARIVIAERLSRPRAIASTSTFDLAEAGGVTTIAWSRAGTTLLRSRLRAGTFHKPMDARVGPDLARGLAGLRALAEA